MCNNKRPERRHGVLGRRQWGHIDMLRPREIPGNIYPSIVVRCTAYELKVLLTEAKISFRKVPHSFNLLSTVKTHISLAILYLR